MRDILHRVGIRSTSIESVYDALTSIKGLSGWWTTDTQGEAGEVNGIIRFRFGAGGFDMRVVGLDPPAFVHWEVLDGPEEWKGTSIRFDLHVEGDYVIVLFKHLGWQAPVEFMHHCSTKWAVFLMSLKAFVETGKGAPNPYDAKIDNWN